MKIHLGKLEVLKEVVDIETYEFILAPRQKRTQFPDLFCYSKSESNWFLCEVKRKGDIIRPEQPEFIIEHMLSYLEKYPIAR